MQTGDRTIPEDEIDFGKIGGRFGGFIKRCLQVIRRHLLLFAGTFVLALLLAFAFKFLLPKSYRSSFIIRPNDRTEKFHLRIIGDLQMLIKQDDNDGLGRELDLDARMCGNLERIEAFNPFVKNRSDSINYTEVTLHVSDPSLLLPFQHAIVNYIETRPHFSKIRDLNRWQMEMQLEQVDKDLAALDSLKKVQLQHYARREPVQAGQLLPADLLSPTATYTMSNERIARKSSLMGQKVFLDNFQVIKSCVIVKQHAWPPRVLHMTLALGLFFSFICLVVLLSRKKV